MSGGWLPLLWLVFVLGTGAWLLSALVALAASTTVVGRVSSPMLRGRRILLLAGLPWLAPVTLAAAVAAAATAKFIGWIVDHCAHHGLGHPHLCFSHLPAIELGLLQGALAGIVALGVVEGAARLAWRQYRAGHEIGMLKALAASRGRFGIVPAAAPFALAGGVRQPVVLLSRGLLDRLTPRQRRIVIAHEAAHLRHGDLRRNLLLELLLIPHLPAARRGLRQAWLRSLEERADDAAARRFGAEDVVATLLQVARLELRQPRPGFSVAGGDLAGRARRLLDGDRVRPCGLPCFEITYASGLAAVFAAAVTGHHTLETLLGLLAGH
jgi:hypothetical protein